jgi:hypothetical protein
MRFLAQFYCDPVRLPLKGTLCVQIYQADPEEFPWPEVVRVSHGAPENTDELGIAQPGVIPHDVLWEYREDPGAASDDDVHLAQSKTGGTCYFLDCLQPDERLFLQLREQPGDFNFGGYTLVVGLRRDGSLRATLG